MNTANTRQTTIMSLLSTATILVSAWGLKIGDFSAELRTIIALLPAIPTVLLIISMARAIIGMDEMQRKIQIEGLAIAFGGTALATMVIGMLRLADVGVPPVSHLYIYVLMVLLYGIGTWLAGRRYE